MFSGTRVILVSYFGSGRRARHEKQATDIGTHIAPKPEIAFPQEPHIMLFFVTLLKQLLSMVYNIEFNFGGDYKINQPYIRGREL